MLSTSHYISSSKIFYQAFVCFEYRPRCVCVCVCVVCECVFSVCECVFSVCVSVCVVHSAG
jgi:hypothetical protein